VIEAVEVIGGVVAFSALTLAAFSVKIVREYQRVVLFRLGRSLGIKGPGTSPLRLKTWRRRHCEAWWATCCSTTCSRSEKK